MKLSNRFAWKVAGEAGHGILNAGLMFAKTCLRGGLYVFATAEYPSLIRGGHNHLDVRVSEKPVFSQTKCLNLLVALNAESIKKHARKLEPGGGIIYDGDEIKMHKSSPQGAIETPINPIALSIIGGATFVARCYSFDIQNLVQTVAAGIKHKGFAVIDIMQHCPTYNKINTLDWYRSSIVKLPADHDVHDAGKALKLATEGLDGKIPYGIFYVDERPTYEDCLPAETPPVKADLNKIDVEPLLARYK